MCSFYIVVEDVCLVSEGREGGQYGFFVHPGESVTLPFKYQCFNLESHAPHHKDMPMENGVVNGRKSIKVSALFSTEPVTL